MVTAGCRGPSSRRRVGSILLMTSRKSRATYFPTAILTSTCARVLVVLVTGTDRSREIWFLLTSVKLRIGCVGCKSAHGKTGCGAEVWGCMIGRSVFRARWAVVGMGRPLTPEKPPCCCYR